METPLKPGQTLEGHVYFDSDIGCEFGPFTLPKDGNGKVVKVQANRRDHDLQFTFFGAKYLRLSLPRDALHGSGVHAAGETGHFELVGVRRDYEKEKQEREAKEAKERARAWSSGSSDW
jgi:hypothetical protein